MTTIQVRIDEETKRNAKMVLDDLGLDLSSAVKVYLKHIVITQQIPFKIITENGMTLEQEAAVLKASEEAKKGVNVTKPMKASEAIRYLKNLRAKKTDKRSSTKKR